MSQPVLTLPPPLHHILDRFIIACQVDQRVISVILRGSYASGAADEFSDLDLGVITTNEAYQDFIASKWTFIQKLGEPLFQEDFDHQGIAFFIFSEGVDCELAIYPLSQVGQLHSSPTKVLLDKAGIFPEFFSPHHPLLQTIRSKLYAV